MVVEVIKSIKGNTLPFTSPALSVISHSTCRPERWSTWALPSTAMNAGLDSAIPLDPTNGDLMGCIYATEALLGEDDYCIEYIGAYGRNFRSEKMS